MKTKQVERTLTVVEWIGIILLIVVVIPGGIRVLGNFVSLQNETILEQQQVLKQLQEEVEVLRSQVEDGK